MGKKLKRLRRGKQAEKKPVSKIEVAIPEPEVAAAPPKPKRKPRKIVKKPKAKAKPKAKTETETSKMTPVKVPAEEKTSETKKPKSSWWKTSQKED